MSAHIRYGYTPTGALRHAYLSEVLLALCCSAPIDKAAQPPGPGDRPHLTCMRCAGIVARVRELRALTPAKRRRLAPAQQRGVAWDLTSTFP